MKIIATDEMTYEHRSGVLPGGLPLEQTGVWRRYQASITGRTPWLGEDEGYLLLCGDDGGARAFLTFIDYETHGYHFLRAMHGPVWVSQPSEQEEREALEALKAFVHARDRRIVFLRLAVLHDMSASRVTYPALSTVPYDQTVVLDVTGGDDAILARMKPRGRRDVRKSIREFPGTLADETEQATKSFDDYYAVMTETGARDGFKPAPEGDYEDMIRLLGPDHCRIYAARVDGKVVAWSLVTLNGTLAVRFYAAMRSHAMRLHATDRLLYHEACELGRRGVREYDLMGIGDDFAPSLKGLNEFKTKFDKQVRHIAPDRDVAVRAGFYGFLRGLKKLRGALRH